MALQQKYEVPEMENLLMCDHILLLGLHKNGTAVQDAANADLWSEEDDRWPQIRKKNKCKFLIAYLKKHINNLKSGHSVSSTDQNKVHSMI